MKSLGRYFVTCIVIAVVLAPVMNKDFFKDTENLLISIFFGLFYTLSGLYGSIWLFRYLDEKYSWIKNLWKRLIIGVAVVELWTILVYAILTPLLLFFFKHDSFDRILYEMQVNIRYPLIMGIAGMLIISSVEFFKNWKMSFLKRERLKAEMMTYKYEALHNQLNPHFLFNSFNVLSELVYEDRDLAVQFVDQLGELYEKVLDGKEKELIPLQAELEFIKSYVFLLKTRFQNKLNISINITPESDELIAPMVLQLLIENAVKHNKISKADPLDIEIKRAGSHILVKNHLRLKKSGDKSSGTGLQNITQRYSFFTDLPIVVDRTKHEFLVKIPVLKKSYHHEVM